MPTDMTRAAARTRLATATAVEAWDGGTKVAATLADVRTLLIAPCRLRVVDYGGTFVVAAVDPRLGVSKRFVVTG